MKSNVIADKSQHVKRVDGLMISVADQKVFVGAAEIKEIVRPVTLTPIPMGPQHIIGLANIHGQVVCIIDPGGLTSLPGCNRNVTSRTRFLLLRHAIMHVGIWVDEVHKIQQVEAAILANINKNSDSVQQIKINNDVCTYLQCSQLLV